MRLQITARGHIRSSNWAKNSPRVNQICLRGRFLRCNNLTRFAFETKLNNIRIKLSTEKICCPFSFVRSESDILGQIDVPPISHNLHFFNVCNQQGELEPIGQRNGESLCVNANISSTNVLTFHSRDLITAMKHLSSPWRTNLIQKRLSTRRRYRQHAF